MNKLIKKLMCYLICILSFSNVVLADIVYPISVETVSTDDTMEIHKIYELYENESPALIPKEDFEQAGFSFTLQDILKTEKPKIEMKELTEPVIIESNSNKMEDILTLIAPTKSITTEDGFSGTLTLDISTLKIDSKGTATNSYTMTATRTYPNLAGADLQYIPKTTSENGKTLYFTSVEWQSDNTANIDDYAITDRYTAIVTYSGTGTRSYSKGYTISAEYHGTVSKTSMSKTQYTVIFAGSKIQEVAEPAPVNMDIGKIMYIVLPLLGIVITVGIIVWLFFIKKKGENKNEDNEDTSESNDIDNSSISDSDIDSYPGIRP